MKLYILKKQENIGEFEDPVRFRSTPFVFTSEEDAKKKAKELNDADPECHGSWSLPYWVEEVNVVVKSTGKMVG